MLAAITTVHAVPRVVISKRAPARANTVVCRECSQVLGSTTNPQVRRFLEDAHLCEGKLAETIPASPVPFS